MTPPLSFFFPSSSFLVDEDRLGAGLGALSGFLGVIDRVQGDRHEFQIFGPVTGATEGAASRHGGGSLDRVSI